MTGDERRERFGMLLQMVYRCTVNQKELAYLLEEASYADVFEAVPNSRNQLIAAQETLKDLDAAARGIFEKLGGLAAHLDCGVHPPCDVPGGPDCRCIERP